MIRAFLVANVENLGTWHFVLFALLFVCALVGFGFYLFPFAVSTLRRRNRSSTQEQLTLIHQELDKITQDVGREISLYQRDLKRTLVELAKEERKEPAKVLYQDLHKQADAMLRLTLRLASQLAHGYDELRQQGNQLLAFTEARTDSLTGVSNRRALEEMLGNMLAIHQRYGFSFSLALIDIDHFKKVNDEHGHVRGDELLAEMANFFAQEIRETDRLARYGGEEFVIVMPHTDLAGGGMFCDRLRQLVQARFPSTVSVGVTTVHREDDVQRLLKRADLALYQAKKSGRNKVFLYDGNEMTPYGESGYEYRS